MRPGTPWRVVLSGQAKSSPRRWSPSGTPGTRNCTLMAAPFRA
jgi:hypothetical protein